jgi:replication initiation protein RepC
MSRDIPSQVRRAACAQMSGMRRLNTTAIVSMASDYRPSAKTPGQNLAAFKRAAPSLGISPRQVHAIDWLMGFTWPQDWEDGQRPIVWPSAAFMRESLGLAVTQTKMLTRSLVELGLVIMRDSPNGKRYGRRGQDGRIIEAYGFDLSPLAVRYQEFIALAEAAAKERERRKELRRRATIARRGLGQIIETARDGLSSLEEWELLAQRATAFSLKIPKLEDLDALEDAVASLEALHQAALEQYQLASTQSKSSVTEFTTKPSVISVDKDPLGSEKRPLNTATNLEFNLERDTVVCAMRGRAPAQKGTFDRPVRDKHSGEAAPPGDPIGKQQQGGTLKITPLGVVHLAPRLKQYLRTEQPNWPDLVEAADWLRHELRISREGWISACSIMGREAAAISVALISTKGTSHFSVGPGAYLTGMTKAARTGNLNLAGSFWKLRTGDSL